MIFTVDFYECLKIICRIENNMRSDYSKIDSGVPQGSVFGPLLFLIYINDLERNISSNIKFFVDDTMLFSIVKDPVISANDLNHDLDVIYQWAYRWEMEFNPDSTKHATEILFICKKSSLQICKIMNKNTLSYQKEKLPNRREMFCGKVCTTFHTIICK